VSQINDHYGGEYSDIIAFRICNVSVGFDLWFHQINGSKLVYEYGLDASYLVIPEKP